MPVIDVIRARVTPFVTPVCLVAGWDLLVRSKLLPPSQAAAPLAVLGTLGHLLYRGSLLQHTGYSLGRLLVGVGVGCGFAIFFSLAVVLSAKVSAALLPTVRVFAGVPVVLWMPFCVILVGTGEMYKMSLVSLATFLLVQVFVIQSLRSTERRFLELAEMYEKTNFARVKHVLLPGSMPAILTAVRAAMAGGWIILFFVEFAASETGHEGLGWFVADARTSGRVEEEFAGLFWLAAVAFILDFALARYQLHKLRWVDTTEHSQLKGTAS